MKLMILDGNSVINRAFYGIRPLTTKEGLYTNAIFGFLNILQKLEQEERPDALCVAFDLHGPTFRHLQYDGYKATRHGMPEELAMQMPVMKDVLRAMSIPIYECQGWEADDVIGTVSVTCCAQGWQCVVVTGDRDSLQLVNDCVSVKLLTTKSGAVLYTPQVFEAEYGFGPGTLIDLKGLMGDSSDNIPGVAGIGPKTATDLLLKFKTLDGVYANIDSKDIRESVRKKLLADEANARLSYDLATIRCEAPIEFAPEDALKKPVDKAALRGLFLKLEFDKLLDRYGLRDTETPVTAVRSDSVRLVETLPDVHTPCAIHFDWEKQEAAVAWEQGESPRLPLGGRCHEVTEGEKLANFREFSGKDRLSPPVSCADSPLPEGAKGACGTVHVCVAPMEKVRPICEGAAPKCCADWKTLRGKLLDLGWEPKHFDFDVSLAAYLLDPQASDYSPAKLSMAYLNTDAENLESQACGIWQLKMILREKLKESDMDKLYTDIELPLCDVLSDMERTGITVDRMALMAFGSMLDQRIAETQKTIFALAGEEFNVNSTKKLGEILFEKLGLPPVKKTKTGYSTNAEVLEKLRDKHPIVDAVLEYRMLTKLSSTYAEGLLKVIAEDGRIHSTFQNMVTATGRLSSTEPNLQNIPVRRELGGEIRNMFVAGDGCVLVDADYSQIELRVLAHMADDKAMQESFISNEDVHAVTASQVFGVPLDQVDKEMRRRAKAVNFGIVYGISAWSLSQDIGVYPEEAKAYMDAYLAHYAGVRSYMKDIVAEAKEKGFVTTLCGRRRAVPELKSSNFNLRAFGERVALNTPIQGTAADIIKIAMIRVDQALKKAKLQAKLILQVHDELIVECPMAEAEKVKKILTREMEQAAKLNVPLLAEAKQGVSWHEAK